MEQKVLSDPSQYPSEDVIFAHIGGGKALWQALFDHIHSTHPGMTTEWHYYNDGKSWLLKGVQKKKTIFWLSVIPGSFRTTFYFGDKAEALILPSAIPEALKQQFLEGKHFGKIRGVTITYHDHSDVEAAKEMISLKLKMK